ncbi:TVP38/TMEM64 family protein, partial [Streptomyces gulbargensis]
VLGVIPSFFITAGNLFYFGFWGGTLISFIGESIGALVAFFLYRKGLKKQRQKWSTHNKLKLLVDSSGKEAFLLILLLRVIPYVPSALVTLAASVSKISWTSFFIASSVGKIPAVVMEALTVYGLKELMPSIKFLLIILSVGLLVPIIKSIIRYHFKKE